jgi:transposase
MARPKTKLDARLLKKAEDALDEHPDGKGIMRLYAIIATAELPGESVADFMHVTRPTLYDWINRFAKDGIDGLRDRPKGHYASKLSDEQMEIIGQWIETRRNSKGRIVHWTLGKLQQEIKAQFEISVSQPAIWNHLQKCDYTLRVPRPRHHKGDEKEQEKFKKK